MRAYKKMRIGKKCANTAKTKFVKRSYLMEEPDWSRMVPKDYYMLTPCSAWYYKTEYTCNHLWQKTGHSKSRPPITTVEIAWHGH